MDGQKLATCLACWEYTRGAATYSEVFVHENYAMGHGRPHSFQVCCASCGTKGPLAFIRTKAISGWNSLMADTSAVFVVIWVWEQDIITGIFSNREDAEACAKQVEMEIPRTEYVTVEMWDLNKRGEGVKVYDEWGKRPAMPPTGCSARL
jgi:hypothetical protein